jgi:hypothetical protein
LCTIYREKLRKKIREWKMFVAAAYIVREGRWMGMNN